METRQIDRDLNRDDQRPDGAKHDELGRTAPEGRPSKASPRQQPAKAVHLPPDEPKKPQTDPGNAERAVLSSGS
jgi:hypothetical protein